MGSTDLICAFTQLEQVVHEFQCLCECVNSDRAQKIQSMKASGIGYPAANHVQLPHTEAKFISNTGPERMRTHTCTHCRHESFLRFMRLLQSFLELADCGWHLLSSKIDSS